MKDLSIKDLEQLNVKNLNDKELLTTNGGGIFYILGYLVGAVAAEQAKDPDYTEYCRRWAH